MRWEYRVHIVRMTGEERDDSQALTNAAGPAIHEQATANGWEIFHIERTDDDRRCLFMKRPAQGF